VRSQLVLIPQTISSGYAPDKDLPQFRSTPATALGTVLEWLCHPTRELSLSPNPHLRNIILLKDYTQGNEKSFWAPQALHPLKSTAIVISSNKQVGQSATRNIL
jgi:hypothetical protein